MSDEKGNPLQGARRRIKVLLQSGTENLYYNLSIYKDINRKGYRAPKPCPLRREELGLRAGRMQDIVEGIKGLGYLCKQGR